MFLIDQPAVSYSDPWNEGLAERLRRLYKGKRRVAYFYTRPDNSTFRYRVYNMLESLAYIDDEFSGTYFAADDFDTLYSILEHIEVLVFCRVHYTGKVSQLIFRARTCGVRLLFDVDDLVFDPDFVHLVVDTVGQNTNDSYEMWVTWFADFARTGAVMRLCDGGITTNAYLANRIRHYANFPVDIIPNFLNPWQLQLAEQIYDRKLQRGFARDKRIHIGYFSGSPTHNKDFDIAANAIRDMMAADSRIALRIVGFLDLPASIREYMSRIEFFPLSDFVNLQRLIGETEINIVPLQNNIFTNCKSDLKFFEAGIVGTITISSGTFTFRNVIRHGYNGFLAQSWEWGDHIQTVIGLLESHQYQDVAARAFDDAKANYSPEAFSRRLRSVLFGVGQAEEPRVCDPGGRAESLITVTS